MTSGKNSVKISDIWDSLKKKHASNTNKFERQLFAIPSADLTVDVGFVQRNFCANSF